MRVLSSFPFTGEDEGVTVESYWSQELGLAWLLEMMLLDGDDELGGSVFVHAMFDCGVSEKE